MLSEAPPLPERFFLAEHPKIGRNIQTVTQTQTQPGLFKKNLVLIFLFAVLTMGITARFWDLSQHFTNTDDLGIIEVTFEAQKAGNLFHLPTILTNAPFQYVLTYFLLTEKMSYEELLFWCRLPSCLFGGGALAILLLFYFDYARKQITKALLGLTLLACSWEAIIFSKQTHSYSIGVLASALLCLLLIDQMKRRPQISPAWLGVFLALIASMQYQALVFLPALLISLYFYRRPFAGSQLALIKPLGITTAVCGLVFYPVWKFFLRNKPDNFHATLDWTLGANREFAFPNLEAINLLQAILKSVWFYIKNFYFIFESKISFIPDNFFLFQPITFCLFVLFCLGVIHFFITPNRKTRHIGIFFGGCLLTWWILVPLKQFPYTPSRHTLILLPFFCITIAEGLDGLRRLLKKASLKYPRFLFNRSAIAISFTILILFIIFYPHFLAERKNPIQEKEVCGLIDKYKVDSMLFDRRSLHLEYMACVRALADKQEKPGEVRTFATVSRYPGVSAQDRCEIFKQMNNVGAIDQLRATGTLPMVMKRECADYKTVYQKEVDTGVMEGFARNLKADIYGNRLYFYILSLDPPPAEPSVS